MLGVMSHPEEGGSSQDAQAERNNRSSQGFLADYTLGMEIGVLVLDLPV